MLAGAAGRCPHCGLSFSPSYDALLIDAVRDVLAAVPPAAGRAGALLTAIAPLLHLAST